MSNIYIQEPPTEGKVLLKTTVGDIDVELWSKEAPKACRNFIQLCLEGYYDNVIFHRVVKGFIAQGGDPSGTGLGGESIYGEPFKDEFHSRLRFSRRGLVGMANAGKNDNGSQFFFTLAETPELQNKHTLFGKVAGATLYNMIKLEDGIVDQNERPLNPHRIISTEILSNPFDDMLPRETKKKVDDSAKAKEQSTAIAKKDFKLLSFGDEAEEEEEENNIATVDLKGKSKSSHDLLKDDPKLSSVPAVDIPSRSGDKRSGENPDDFESTRSRDKKSKRKRLEAKIAEEAARRAEKEKEKDDGLGEDEYIDEKTRQEIAKLEGARSEYKELKKQMAAERKQKDEVPVAVVPSENEAVIAFNEEKAKYKEVSNKIPKKGANREEQALALLAKFKSQLLGQQKKEPSEEITVGPKDTSWMSHKLSCQKEDERPVLAKDANMRGDGDWYDIYDPRNPINQRKAAAAEVSKKKRP